jgi:hypothetical protein
MNKGRCKISPFIFFKYGFEVRTCINNYMKHKHHIIPKHMGGSDDPSNIIELTVDEHAEAHRLLYEQYGRWQDKIAWETLSGQIGKDEALTAARGAANRGKKRTPEQIERIRQAAIKRAERHRLDGTLEEANRKRSEAMKGKKKSDEAIAAWKESRMNNGKPWHSKETRKKIAEGGKGNKNAAKD